MTTNYNFEEDVNGFNMLIGGTDLGGDRTLASNGVRTDVLMLVSYNPSNIRGNNALTVVNIPRDAVAYIPCADTEDKINSAASYGIQNRTENQTNEEAATTCTVETVEYLFDTTIDYYSFADFDTFIKLVDSVGGIDIYNDYEFSEQDEYGNIDEYYFPIGELHLDGSQSLAYARQRHYSSDYERNLRQQVVVTAITEKILEEPTEYTDDFALILSSDTYNNFSYDFIINTISSLVNITNYITQTISNDNIFILDIRSSPFSNQTGFDQAEALTGVDLTETTFYIPDLYYDYNYLEEYTMVNRKIFSNPVLNTAHSIENIVQTEGEPIILEVEFLSLKVNEYEGTSYSVPDEEAVEYISQIVNY